MFVFLNIVQWTCRFIHEFCNRIKIYAVAAEIKKYEA